MPLSVISRPLIGPGAASMPIGSGATHEVICTGKEMSSATRATIAGLNRFWPRPPKTCLARTVAKRPPSAPIHHGAQGGSDSASSQPVRIAEPSPSVGAAGRSIRRRQRPSPSTAKPMVIAHR